MNPLSGRPASFKNARRPSLYTETPREASETQDGSILGELEQRRPRRTRLAVVVAVALCSALAIGWWQADGPALRPGAAAIELAARSGAGLAASVDASKEHVTPAPASGAEPEAVAIKPAGIEEDEKTPAAIVAEPVGTDVVPAAQASTKNARAEPAEPAMPVQATLPAPPVPVPAPPEMTRVAARSEAPAKVAADPAAVPAGGNRSARGGKPAEKDGDVELIAALLSRISAPGAVGREEASRKAASPGMSQRAAADQKKGRKAASLRENAAAVPVETAESQLKRCGSLGFFEREVCRFRICDGRWGRDAACPESSQVSAAAP